MFLKPVLPFLLLSTITVSIKVFNFNDARSAARGSLLSSATLTNGQEEELPDRFVVCFSIKMTKNYELSPFILYGENGESWLAFSFWGGESGPLLWAEVQGFWVSFSLVLEKPWTQAWKHICADVDTSSGNITVSLMGKNAITRSDNTLKSNKPRYLTGKVVIGITKRKSFKKLPLQFFGSVTDINMYSASKNHTVKQLSMGAHKNGDILAWTDMTFDLEGTDFSIDEIEIEKPNGACQFLLPVKAGWHEAAGYCRNLGNGQMAGIASKEELNKTAELVYNLIDSCEFVWMPVTDESLEGKYRNTFNGNLETYLPWGPFQPNGQHSENYVAIKMDDLKYHYHNVKDSYCVSCAMKTTTLFRLRGRCKGSYMGK